MTLALSNRMLHINRKQFEREKKHICVKFSPELVLLSGTRDNKEKVKRAVLQLIRIMLTRYSERYKIV